MKVKICSRCKTKKPISDYYKNGGNKYRSECKSCSKNDYLKSRDRHIENMKKYRKKNKKKIQEYKKEYRKKNPRNYTKEESLRRYGITYEQRQQMEKNQKGRCAICKKKKSLCLDHNHNTGKVRKLLCQKCNTGIGMFDEDIHFLASAIEYLQSF